MDETALARRVREFVASETGRTLDEVTPTTRLWEDLRVYGDDIDDVLEAFMTEFEVDMSTYRWYHHTGPEGCNPLYLFYTPAWAQLTQIPITPSDLVESASRGVWTIQYPDESPDDFRADPTRAVWMLAVGFIGAALYALWRVVST